MAGISLGTTPLAKVSVGSTAIQKISVGSTDVWSSAPVVPVQLTLTQRNAIDAIVAADMAINKKVRGTIIAISTPMGYYRKAYGTADGKIPMTLDHHFRTGSVHKTYTGTLILREVDKGTLALTDTLEHMLPGSGIPNSTIITLQHMMMMRSGIFDYQKDADIRNKSGLNLTADITRDEEVEAMKAPSSFAPGTKFGYTDSNYILMGIILESINGTPIRDQTIQGLLIPEGQTSTTWPTDVSLPTPFSKGYGKSWLGGDKEQTSMNPELFGASGALISTIDDMHRWGELLRDGTLLSPTSHALRESRFCPEPYALGGPANFGYGLGYFRFGRWLGHHGSVPGFNTACFYDPVTGSVFAGMQNNQVTSPTVSIFSKIMLQVNEYLYPGSMADPAYTTCPY